MRISTVKLLKMPVIKAGWTFLFLLFMALNSNGQVRTLSGTVTGADTKESLPGASIVVKGTTTGTVTDIDGRYTLQVPSGPVTLVFSFIGYETAEIAVTTQAVIDVTLSISRVALEEVVVIGYGTVRKSDLSGSVASVKAEDITKITSSNPVQSLQGRVSGVQVTSTSGAPGDNPVVLVRGVGTFNNNSPIYVVDGVIMDNISFLNAADIASMEVLKDASATAIYGSRGANGVIMVTTKSGKGEEGKTVFNFTGEAGLQRVAKMIDLLDGREFAIISNEIKTGSYNNVDAVPNTDWQDLVFDIAPVQNYQLSVAGNSKMMQYYLGVGYFSQKGIIDKSSYEKVTTKFNSTYELTHWLKLGTNISITPFNQQIAPNVTYSAYRAQPLLEPYYADGSYGVVYNVGNPLAELANSNNYRKGLRGVGNAYTEINLSKDFMFKTSLGIDGEYVKAENFTPAYTVYNPDGTASQQDNTYSDLTKANSDMLAWLWENTLNYRKEIKKHAIDAVAGYTMQKTTSEFFSLTGANIVRDDPSLWYINNYSYIQDDANDINTIDQINNEVSADLYYSMISYLFRANYIYNNKYIFTATFRRDGSSKFSAENRYSNFPSFAAGWNISREKFMEKVDLISKLKLRASWGKIGNEKISYLRRFSLVQSDIIAVFGQNSAVYPAASYGQLGNPDLIWEVTSQADVGLEVGLLNDRLGVELDFYNKITDDILVELAVPGYYGNGEGARMMFNAGKALNRGFEYNVLWRDQVSEFKYNVGVLGSTIHNEVLEIGGNSGVDSTLVGGYLGNGIPVTLSKIGLPIGSFYGYQTNGVFQTQEEIDNYPVYTQEALRPGDLRFVDVNKDGVINQKDRTYLGSPIPKFIFGLSGGFEYKGVDFSINIQGQTGNKIFNGKEVVRPDPYNFEGHVMDRWTGPGTSDKEPRPTFGGYNYNISDRFIYDGSFVRIRNVVIGYTLPQDWSQKFYVQNFRIYFKADNLYTFTKFTGYTPEIGSWSVISAGIDNGIYPVSSVYSFGINLTF
jgi:TonB-linked SusC/RagA family outer membrane protein